MRFLILFFLLMVWSCQDSSPSNTPSKTVDFPKTPEAIVRKWQNHLDRNEFKEAKRISTPNAIEWIETIEGFLAEEELDSLTTTTEFLNMKCYEKGNDANCVYLFIDEEGFQFEDTFFLKKMDNLWLVDIPEEEGDLDNQDLEGLLNELRE